MTITKNSPNLFNRFRRSSSRMSGLIPVNNEERHVMNTAPHSTTVGETHATLLTPVVVTIGSKGSDSEEKKTPNSGSLNFHWI